MESRLINYITLLQLVLVSSLLLIKMDAGAQAAKRADSSRVYALLAEADQQYIRGTLEATLDKASEALALSRRARLPRAEALANLKIASVYVKQGRITQVEPLFAQALRTGATLRDSFLLALATYQRGQFLMYQGRHTMAEEHFHRSLDLHFNRLDSRHKGQVYNDLGYLFGQKGELEKQVQWLLKAIRVHEQLNDPIELAVSKGNLGLVYHSLGNKPEAIRYIRQSIQLKEANEDMQGLTISYGNLANIYTSISLDSALHFHGVAATYAERNNLKSALIQSHTNLSAIYDLRARNGDREENKRLALEHILTAIELCRQTDDEIGSASKIRWAGQLYGDLNDTAEMERHFSLAMNIGRKAADKSIIRDIYGARASSYAKKKNFEAAWNNIREYYKYRDSLVNEKTATNIAELQTQYETEKKDNEIARLETEQQIKQLNIEKQEAIIAGNKLDADRKESEIQLLSKQQELRDIRIRQQEEALDNQLLLARNNEQALLLADQEKLITRKALSDQRFQRNVMIAGLGLFIILALVIFNRYQLSKKLQQQKELLTVRNNIAKDLHDEIGSTLTSIKILSQVSYKHLGDDTGKSSVMLRKIAEQSDQMQQGMSDIVWAITPQNDRLENLVVRMREYIRDTLEPRQIDTQLEVDENILGENIGMQQRRDFYLIFREALNNIVKHANCKSVNVQLIRVRDEVQLTITDDGCGFLSAQASSGNGLKNMKARASSMNGSLAIETGEGGGTKLTLTIPASGI